MLRFALLFLLAWPCATHAQHWTQTNGPEGGYLKNVAYWQGRLWAAGAGGLFYSDNLGDEWVHHPLLDWGRVAYGLCTHNDKLFVIAPADEFGQPPTLRVSADNGQTWQTKNIVSSQIEFFGLGFDLYQSAGRLVLTDGYEVFISSANEGDSWSDANLPIGAYYDQIVANRDRLLVPVDDEQRIYFSEDGGQNWPHSIALDFPPGTYFYAQNFDSLLCLTAYGASLDSHLVSLDLGATWSPLALQVPDNQSIYMFQGQGDTLLAMADEVYFSTDQTATWSVYTTAPGLGINWVFAGGRVLVAASGRGVRQLDRPNDTWLTRNNGLTNVQLARTTSFDGQLLGQSSSLLYQTADGGDTWTNRSVQFAIGDYSKLVYRLDSAVFFAGGNRLYRSTDSLATVTVFWQPTSSSIRNVDYQADKARVLTSSELITLDLLTGTFVSTDLPANLIYPDQVAFTPTGTFLFEIFDEQLWRTLDGGQTWDIAFVPPIQPGASNVALFNLDPGALWLFYRDSLYVSGNNGQTWGRTLPANWPTDQSDNRKIPSRLVRIGATFVVLVPQTGIWVSTNSGQSWMAQNQGFDGAETRVSDITVHDGVLYASTTTASVWKFDPTSLTWQVPDIQSISLSPNPASDWLDLPHQAQHLRVVDVAGRVVYTQVAPAPPLDVRTWRSGVYFLFFEKNSKMYRAKVVVSH
jgi:photosystem II stability/assembly factor-like uncharacterized protein